VREVLDRWCAETDAALLLALAAGLLSAAPRASSSALAAKNELAERVAATVRWQMAFFYLGAAFWKVNTSFLDHRYSCAPLFFASIMAAYLPADIATPGVTAAVIRHAPMIIVVGELAIAAAFLAAAWGRSQGALSCNCSKIGVILALCLHLGIAVTPPPNNVGAFSVIMVARLFFFAPQSSARVLRDTLVPRSGIALCCSAMCTALAAAATALAAFGAHFVSSEAEQNQATDGGVGQLGIMFYRGLDWSGAPPACMCALPADTGPESEDGCLHRSVPTFVVMMWIVGGGALLATPQPPAKGPGERMSTLGAGLAWLAAAHSLLVTPLGLQDLGGESLLLREEPARASHPALSCCGARANCHRHAPIRAAGRRITCEENAEEKSHLSKDLKRQGSPRGAVFAAHRQSVSIYSPPRMHILHRE